MLKKFIALFSACFILIGLVVIYYWRDIQYQAESADLINYFLILPIVVGLILLSPLLIYKTYQHFKNKKQQALLAEQNQTAVLTDSEPTVIESKYLQLNIYAATAYSALGENAAIVDAIKQSLSPQLDQNLVDDQGLAILSYRIEDLDQQFENMHENSLQLMSVRQLRIMALIHHQLEQHTELLVLISDQLKRSSLFYEGQTAYQYRMHPAWHDPNLVTDEPHQEVQPERVYRLDRLNLHIILSEDELHVWNDLTRNESIQPFLHGLDIISEKYRIEYHYLSAASTEQHLFELMDRIQSQPHEISLIMAVDSEIDQELLDQKIWSSTSYIPAEFISTFCLAHPALQLEQVVAEKSLKLLSNQNNINQIIKQLEIAELPQYEEEQALVMIVEDANNIKMLKKLNQFFNSSPIDTYHYLYCNSTLGHSQNLAKVFGLMLAAHLSDSPVAFVYANSFQAIIQDIPEITENQQSAAITN